jgi:hypothetical protein
VVGENVADQLGDGDPLLGSLQPQPFMHVIRDVADENIVSHDINRIIAIVGV